ncbi:PleD family two-component system response regulator [candidate division KSB1 bacterium]
MKTILIVDDNPEIQQVISTYIKNYTEYKPIVAEDGESAIDIIKMNKPDLVLIDILLPRIGGIALYKNIRQMPTAKATPVIFMSGAMIDKVFQDEGIEMGAVDYITKPIDFKYLIDKIISVLEKS